MLMHADDGRINHLHGCIMACGQRIHELVPHASPAPANKAIVAGGVWAEVVRQIAPWRTRTQDPEDAIEHAAVVYTRNAARLVRQERLDGSPFVVGEFVRGLRELGYVENQNIVLEPRSAEGKSERLPLLARELVAAKPDLIYVLGGDVAPSVRAATSTIPIVMAVSNDPVLSNLVASLARPGGNITGVTFVSSDLAAKRLQFLHELAPQLTRIAVLWNPDHVDPEYRETQAAGKTLGIQVHSLEARSRADLESAYQT